MFATVAVGHCSFLPAETAKEPASTAPNRRLARGSRSGAEAGVHLSGQSPLRMRGQGGSGTRTGRRQAPVFEAATIDLRTLVSANEISFELGDHPQRVEEQAADGVDRVVNAASEAQRIASWKQIE